MDEQEENMLEEFDDSFSETFDEKERDEFPDEEIEGEEQGEDPQEELFRENPIKALWLKLNDVDEKLEDLINALSEDES